MEEVEVEQASTADGQGIPDPQADPRADQSGEGNGLTLQERIRRDPDFAWDQMQKRDAKISEQANRIKQYEVIDPYLQSAGGPEHLLGLATIGSQIRNVNGLADFVQQSIEQGRVAFPEPEKQNDSEEDEWLDADTKRIRDEARQEIQALKSELGELRKVASVASTRSQEVHVRENVTKALGFFESDPEALEEAKSIVQTRVQNAQRLAEQGDATQQKLIDQLAQPNGHEALEYMLVPVMKKYGNKLFAASNTETKEDGRPTVVTSSDERLRTPSRPGTPQLSPLPKGPVTPQIANTVFSEIARMNGRPLR